MGIRFRKSKKLKDGRIITLSPNGITISYDMGNGVRITQCADGSTRETINLGNGVSYTNTIGKKKKRNN